MSSPASPGYSGWRPALGFGFGRLSGRRGLILGVVIVGIGITLQISWQAAVLEALIAIPVLAVTVVPFGAELRTVSDRVGWWMRGKRAHARNTDAVSAGPLREIPRGEALPGVLAPLMPLDVEDGRGGTQCLLWNRRTGVLSVVLLVSPVGLTLADTDDANSWVATFGAWLADLGYKPIIHSVSFTVESSPTGGVNQRAYTMSRLDPASPAIAQQVMRELVDSQPRSTAEVVTTVTINFDPARANPRPKDLLSGAAEVVRWLPGIEASLSAAGATVIGRASTPWLIRRVRSAFDPAVRVAMSDADDTELMEWADAGPIRAEQPPPKRCSNNASPSSPHSVTPSTTTDARPTPSPPQRPRRTPPRTPSA